MAGQANLSLTIYDSCNNSTVPYPCFTADMVGISIIGSLVVVCVIGNILTFVVFWKGNFKSSTAFLFMTLSLIDSVVLLTVLVVVLDHACLLIGVSNVRIYMSACVYPLHSMSLTATVWVTVLNTVNRYIIVCLPLRASQWCTHLRVKVQLAVVLVFVALYNIPDFAEGSSSYADSESAQQKAPRYDVFSRNEIYNEL